MPRIGRYENPYLTVEFHREPPAGTTTRVLGFVSEDRANSHGVLWLPPGPMPKTVLTLMHPRGDFIRHYAVPGLLDAGYAVLAQNSRWVGNDSTLVHEQVLLDVAAGMKAMRELGFERVIPIGNSGGGALYSFYISQAHAPSGQRLTDTAAGDPFDLNRFSMPPVDAMAYMGAHPGEGLFLMHTIDPSVVEEDDPVACDADLDMYDPRNGFAPPPEPTRYSEEFVAKYRAAQRARVDRIDRRARALVARKHAARRRAAQDGSDTGAWRESIATRFMTVYRTEADHAYVDLSIDPSTRDYGSLWTHRPDLFNYGAFGFARLVTPEAWLSTWSGLSSRAAIPLCGARIDLPAIVVGYSGDNGVFRRDAKLIHDSLATADKSLVEVDADHYGFPPSGKSEWGRDRAVATIVEWLRGKGY